MKVLIFSILLIVAFKIQAQQTKIQPYELKADGEEYELKENKGMSKIQRIGRNELALQDIYKKLEALEAKVKNLESANKNPQKKE